MNNIKNSVNPNLVIIMPFYVVKSIKLFFVQLLLTPYSITGESSLGADSRAE